MKIAILTSGILPIPAVQGGAVESLVDAYLDYNDKHHLHDITVYSIAHSNTKGHPALRSVANHYHYTDTSSLVAKVRKNIHRMLSPKGFYHYSIEYYFEQAARHIGSHDYDMVIIENRPGFAMKLSAMTSARIVHHLHNDILNSSTPHCQMLYDAAHRIVTVSDYIAQRVRTINANDTKCITVHNGIDTRHFAPGLSAPADRERYGIGADDFVLIFTGRIIPEKGIGQLVEAMCLLKEHHHIKLLVLGSAFYANDNTEGSFIHQLKEKARSLGDRIVFTGYAPYADMPSMLHMADVAVLPSTWEEPFGLTCAEAMAAGLPLITTRQGGIPEVTPPDAALLLEADDQLPQRLASAILLLEADRERCRHMGKAALQASQQFSKDTYAENFFKAISI